MTRPRPSPAQIISGAILLISPTHQSGCATYGARLTTAAKRASNVPTDSCVNSAPTASAPTHGGNGCRWCRLTIRNGKRSIGASRPRVRFGATSAPADFAQWPAHDGGDQFLDLCWNHGVNPIYVVIGISVDPWFAFQSTNPDSAQAHDERMYIERTTQWLAQRYGYHPAVLGFAIGNETNLPFALGTDRYIDYWQYLNHLGAVAKHYAPDKLTMTAFADYPPPETPMLLKPLVAFKACRGRSSRRADGSGLRRSRRRQSRTRLQVGASAARLSRRRLRARRLGLQRLSQTRN